MCILRTVYTIRWFLPLPPINMSISLRLRSVSALNLFRIFLLLLATVLVLPFFVSISIGIPVSNDSWVIIIWALRNIFTPPAEHSRIHSTTLSRVKLCAICVLNLLYPPKLVLLSPLKEPLFYNHRTSYTDLCTSSFSSADDDPGKPQAWGGIIGGVSLGAEDAEEKDDVQRSVYEVR